jgi:hypothetical protein
MLKGAIPVRTWAHLTAKTVLLTASFAASAGFSGVAFAAGGSQASGGGSAVSSGLGSLVGGNPAGTLATLPSDVCQDAAAVLGLGLAGCGGSASASSSPASAGGSGATGTAGTAGSAGSVAGATGRADGSSQAGSGQVNGLSTPSASGLSQGNASSQNSQNARSGGSGSTSSVPASATSGNRSAAADSQDRAQVTAPSSVCGDTAAALGDSAAGCEGTAAAGAPNGHTFADTPETGTAPSRPGAAGPGHSATGTSGDRAIPATTLAADSPSRLSNVSIYSLAIGALVAGAVALKMAGRRFRGRHQGRRV